GLRPPGGRVGGAGAGRLPRAPLAGVLVDALAEPVEPARVDRLGQAGPHDQHVVLVLPQAGQPVAEELAQASLHLVPGHRGTDRLRDGQSDAGTLAPVLAREPVKDEVARRNRPAVPVDGVEVPRAREAMAALHARRPARSGRQALAAPGAAPLEDRAAGARGHSGAEPVTALPPTHVGLIGP